MNTFVIDVSYSSLLCCLVCSMQPCDHLLGNDWPLGSLVCCVLCVSVFVTLAYSVLVKVWYLIVSIPDLCFPCAFGWLRLMMLGPVAQLDARLVVQFFKRTS